MALIGEDCSISITFGTQAFSTGIITWGTLVAITGKARRISAEDSVELANTKAIGNARKLHRAHSGNTRIDIEEVVGWAGYQFLAARVTPIGLPIRVTMLEISSLGAGSVFEGVVEKWKGDIQSTEVQIESLSIMCDIDHG
jgi:hypothetical protein